MSDTSHLSTSQHDVQSQARELKDQAVSAATQIKDAAAGEVDRLESAIRRNPMAAAGIAAGVGFVLALLARR